MVTVNLLPFSSDAEALDGAQRMASAPGLLEVEVRRGGVALFTVTNGGGPRARP